MTAPAPDFLTARSVFVSLDFFSFAFFPICRCLHLYCFCGIRLFQNIIAFSILSVKVSAAVRRVFSGTIHGIFRIPSTFPLFSVVFP